MTRDRPPRRAVPSPESSVRSDAPAAAKRWLVGRPCTVLGIAFSICLPLSAPAVAQDNPLYDYVKDQRVISEQIRRALPAAAQGYELLSASTEAGTVNSAVGLLTASYRYLRGAQGGIELVMASTKFPDPLLALQARQIRQVRNNLLTCVDNRWHLANLTHHTREACLAALAEGIPKLRILATTVP